MLNKSKSTPSLSHLFISVATRNTDALLVILDGMEDPSTLPLICDVNRCGLDGHRWVGDVLEEWRLEEAEEWSGQREYYERSCPA